MMKIRMLVMATLVLLGAGCAGSNGPEATDTAAAPVAAVDKTVDCPGVASVKYPFLRCTHDAAGQVVFDAEPQLLEVSQMPEMDPFVENDDYWGN